MFTVLWFAFLAWLFFGLAYGDLLPWLNKRIFSKIWSEEARPIVAREAIERIKELCVDGDVPEETAVLMAAQENNINEDQLLSAFSADDAKELVAFLSQKKPSMGTMLLKKLAKFDKAGMGYKPNGKH